MTPPALFRGALSHGLARVLTLALGLALLVAVARMGPQVQGGFALFVAVESAMLTLCSGLGLVLAREVSHAGAPPAPLLRGLLRLATLLGVAVALGLAGWAALSGTPPYAQLWLLALAAPWLLWAPTASGQWLGQGRVLALNAPLVAAPALVLALLTAAAAAGTGAPPLWAVLAAWVGAKTLVALATGWAALRRAPPAAALPAGGLLRQHGRFVAMVGLANVVSLLNLRATLFIVERAEGLASAGVYSVAVQVAELLWVLSQAVSVAAYSRIGAADRDDAARLALQVARTGLALALAAAPLLALAAWWLLPEVLGPAYAAARVPLLLLLPGVALYAAASGLSAYYTNHLGRPQWAARVAGLSLAVTLAVALVAVPAYGAAGAAGATALAYAAAMAIAMRAFLRDQGWTWAALWRGAPPAQSRSA